MRGREGTLSGVYEMRKGSGTKDKRRNAGKVNQRERKEGRLHGKEKDPTTK